MQCQCLTLKGTQCSRQAKQGSKYCLQHKNCKQTIKTSIETKTKQRSESKAKHPSRNLTRLSGPSRFTFYPNIHGKRILLLGEIHFNRYICPWEAEAYEIHDWLYDLTQDSQKCIDLFVEQSYVPISSKKRNKNQTGGLFLDQSTSPLLAIRWMFENEKEYSDQLRYHYVDVREIDYRGYNIYVQPYQPRYPFVVLDDILHRTKGKEAQINQVLKKYQDQKKQIFSYLLTIDQKKSSQDLCNQLLKELHEAIGDTSYVDIDLDIYMQNYNQIINKAFSKIDPIIQRDRFFQILLELYEQMNDDLFHVCMYMPMDVYVLCRLFIRFDPNKMNRGPLGCRNLKYQEAKNVIIYGGVAHIDLYASFFEKYFNVRPSIDYNLGINQCIGFDKPFDFWEAT
jgi:hypothetical protein